MLSVKTLVEELESFGLKLDGRQRFIDNNGYKNSQQIPKISVHFATMLSSCLCKTFLKKDKE